MKLQLIIRDKFSIVLFLTVFFLATAIVRAQTETGLPGNAFAGVVPAPNGRLYGLTYIGGTSNQGTLYSVDAALMAVVVHVNFNGANGSTPYDELVFDAASGKFYGATSAGGSSGLGTIFSFDPATNALTTLKGDFDSSIYEPRAPFVVSGGFIYGVLGRPFGGVFRMGTDGSGFTVIHNFTTFNTRPYAVTLGADGRLYGVTLDGGFACIPGDPNTLCGTVFRLRAVLPGDTDVQFQTLYQMQTFADAGPQRTVVYGSDGLIYFNNHRRIFRLNPNNPAATFQMIWDEPGGSISMSIIEGADNRLYAASYDNSQSFAGTVFSLNRDGSNRRILRTFSFTAGSTAYGPYGRLFRTSAGDIYGTTEYTNTPPALGTVFRINDRNLASNQFVLSGSSDGTAPIIVDDGLDIYQNGTLIYTDGNNGAGYRFPIVITANPGDTLRFIVRDTYGVCAKLSAVYLTDSLGNGTLADPGFDLGCGRPNIDLGVVHDFTYTIGSTGNTPPVLSNVTITSAINENGIATLTGNIADANAGDAFSLTVDWGDGSALQTFNYPAGTTSFSETHQYLDDNPTATSSDIYTVNLTLSDGAASDTDSAAVTVNNLAPVLSGITISPATITVGGSTSLSGNVNDVGTLDTHTVVINWGDGSPNTMLNLAAGNSTFSTAHQYNASGNFNITITATDDDGASANGGASVTVNPLPPAAPTNLTATAVSMTQINLAWTDNANNETSFLIERCDGNGRCTNFVLVGQTGANITVFSNIGLTPNTNYSYRVRAFNAAGGSAFSNIAKAKTPRR